MVYRDFKDEKILCVGNAERTRAESWDRVYQGLTAYRTASGRSVVTDERSEDGTSNASVVVVVIDEHSEDDTRNAWASVASASNASVVVVVTVVRAKRGRFVVVIIMRATRAHITSVARASEASAAR